jgi:hypothetical protein
MAIELQDTGQEVLELDFENPEKGVSICQIEEGIQLYTNENSGKTSLRIPMVIDSVETGPEGNVGLKLSHFCPIETAWGEKQMAGILTIIGLMGACVEKFGTQVDSTSEQFINFLKLKLPGKFIRVHHDVKPDNKGKERATVVRFERLKNKLDAVDPIESKKAENTGSAEAASDW